MNFSQADAACRAEGAALATFKQLGDAQQVSPPTGGVTMETTGRAVHLAGVFGAVMRASALESEGRKC